MPDAKDVPVWRIAASAFQRDAGRLRRYRKDAARFELLYAAAALCGEASEVADAWDAWVRGGSARECHDVLLELGDVFWYLASVADHLDSRLGDPPSAKTPDPNGGTDPPESAATSVLLALLSRTGALANGVKKVARASEPLSPLETRNLSRLLDEAIRAAWAAVVAASDRMRLPPRAVLADILGGSLVKMQARRNASDGLSGNNS